MRRKTKIKSALLLFPGFVALPASLLAAETATTLSDVVVSDESEDGRPETPSKTDFATPKTKVTKAAIEKTNAVTTVDAVKFESGVFARQRYIGDQNAPIGMRGSNPYQGGRVMVFMDGMPIWNPLQISFNGSPRWGLIGPGEVKSIDVLSGPFSAEYSGNAMGGVLNYNTLMPQKREIYTEATYFVQPYEFEGTKTNLQGFKTFASYGDKFGDFSTYFSYNHIENEGQPMTPQFSGDKGFNRNTALAGLPNGAFLEKNPRTGQYRYNYGDDGIQHSVDDLYKWKGSYAINPELETNFVIAFQNFERTNTGQSFIERANGTTVWPGSTVANSGSLWPASLGASPTTLGTSTQTRQTLTLGWGLKGRIAGDWYTNTNISFFDILKDQTISSNYNPQDPNRVMTGRDSSFDDSGWFNISTKLNNEQFLGRKDLSFATGYEFQHARILLSQNNLSNYSNITNAPGNPLVTRSGGTTDTHALFGQLSWRFIKDWDATVGTRIERWNTYDGIYLSSTAPAGSGLTNAQALAGALNPADRQVSRWSPKFSLGYEPGRWKFRYSVGKAYKFALPEELYGNSNGVSGNGSISDSTLKPEDGTHHNLLAEYDFNNGYVRLNLFHENVRNAIYSVPVLNRFINPASINPNGTTNLTSSIGEVETDGLDFTVNHDRIFGSDFDIKLNTTILNAEIIENQKNPALVGKQFPLMPNYRANLLTTYHVGNDVDLSVGTRYSGRQFSQPDNSDLQLPYYSAFTESVYVDLKATYRFNKAGHVSAGIDNINDYQAFYNHPLPQRTFFAQVGYKF
ncbi:TonB-dependent receptor [Methylomonas koyamae]|uniref:TonB-dependent receptor n=1 Tax=Methylomonas koyamae TaxID=702114 RepID=UPI0006D0C797|nr:TonB-dependent receptor [Methylomonas koyamae]BBL59737.1 TonB-dependent receptor [Methylomonas koyamae]